MIAEMKAAPAAEKALSPKFNSPFEAPFFSDKFSLPSPTIVSETEETLPSKSTLVVAAPNHEDDEGTPGLDPTIIPTSSFVTSPLSLSLPLNSFLPSLSKKQARIRCQEEDILRKVSIFIEEKRVRPTSSPQGNSMEDEKETSG